MNSILSSCYAGNVNYFSCIKASDQILMDGYEYYSKQSFRNRCEIYGANGRLNLIIPIKRRIGRLSIKDIEIDYSQNWQKIHWKSLESCYRSSPYFEYYEDRFKYFYFQNDFTFLLKFNQHLMNVFMDIINLDKHIGNTLSYKEKHSELVDLREMIHPKKKVTGHFVDRKYHQVFQDKHGYLSNLSIFDLIFNEGPASPQYLG